MSIQTNPHQSPVTTGSGFWARLAQAGNQVAFSSAIIALVSTVFGGWQAFEAHQANEEARQANADAQSANELVRSYQAQDAERAKRELAEKVYLMDSPDSVRAVDSGAALSVLNLSPFPVTNVWLVTPGEDGKGWTVYKLGTIGGCQAVGFKGPGIPQKMLYQDANGRWWARLSFRWQDKGDAIYLPQESSDHGPAGGENWPFSGTRRVNLPSCLPA